MEPGLIFTLCIIGFSLLIPGLILFFLMQKKKRLCTVPAEALVIAIRKTTDSDGSSYCPVYEFRALDGTVHRCTGASLSSRLPDVGDRIRIFYDPNAPEHAFIPGYDDKAFRILSAVFLSLGCIPIIICGIIWILSQ